MPTVVFDAALGASSLSWLLVHPHIAGVTRACAYDRAGFGSSDAGPLPRTAGRIADELHAALQRAAVPGPYLLVGHSFGGFVMRLLAARHPEKIAGLLLIEPAHPEEWADPSPEKRSLIDRGTILCRYGATAARFGLARAVAVLVGIGALGPARKIVRLVSRGGLRRDDEAILAPVWKLPPEVRPRLKDAWTQPKFFEALGSQIASICESASEVAREADQAYGELPLAVITNANASRERMRLDGVLARSSAQGRHVIVENSGHWVPLDAPQEVIDTITGMVKKIRAQLR